MAVIEKNNLHKGIGYSLTVKLISKGYILAQTNKQEATKTCLSAWCKVEINWYIFSKKSEHTFGYAHTYVSHCPGW